MLNDIVTYNRLKRRYEVKVDTETAVFPAGINGKRAAYRLAVWSQSPPLFDMAENMANEYPELEARAWKAAVLVIDDKVTLAKNGQIVAYVEGSNEWGDYNITAVNDELCCDCPDWTGLTAPLLSSGQRLCKHILAFMFVNNIVIND